MSVRTPEAKAKDFIKKYMTNAFPGAWFYSPPGSVFGKAGVPDLLYFWKGILIAIEVKSEVGTLRENQLLQLTLLKEQGAISAVIYGRDIKKLEMLKAAVIKRLEDMTK